MVQMIFSLTRQFIIIAVIIGQTNLENNNNKKTNYLLYYGAYGYPNGWAYGCPKSILS